MGWEEIVKGGGAYLIVDETAKVAFVRTSLWADAICYVDYGEAKEFAEKEGLSLDDYYSSSTLLVYGTPARCS